MLRVLIVLTLVTSPLVCSAAETPDPRAQDAADVFLDLCVNTLAGTVGELDPKRFEVTKLDDATVREIKPDLAGRSVWDVHGGASDVSMLVYYHPAGMCAVEIAEADELSVQRAFDQMTKSAGERLGAEAVAQPIRTRQINGKKASSYSWRFDGPTPILLMVTTYPDPQFMIQHIATISRVR